MNKKCRLEDFRVLDGNSFSKGDVDFMYFSIDKSSSLPNNIKRKIDLMISEIINREESEHGAVSNMAQLEADARLLISTANAEHKPEHIIDVTISSPEADNKEILLYQEYLVLSGMDMFEEFKRYFMNQLENALFGNLIY